MYSLVRGSAAVALRSAAKSTRASAALAACAGVRSRAFASASVLQYTQHGEPLDVLKKVNVDVAAAKSDQVVVRILAAPINPADVNQVQGTYAVLPPVPAVGGNEGVGVIESVGDGVSNLTVGDVVIMGQAGLGTWRTRGLFPAAGLVKVPKDVQVEVAATLGVNACTAYRLLADFVPLKKGDTVLANAGSSGVASALAALCGARGYRLILAMRPRADWDVMVERLKAQGAEAVVEEEFVRTPAFKRLLADMPAPQLALNAVGGRSATELARHLARGGTLVSYGGMSRQPVTLPTSLFIFKDIVARGFWLTAWNKTASPEAKQKMLSELLQLVQSGKLKVFVERHEFDNFADAFKRVHDGQVSRKVVLSMAKK